MQLSVIVPIHNEAGNLPELHRQLTRVLAPLNLAYELVLVDDGSTDDSPRLLAEMVQRDPRVRTVVLRRNFGQTAALQAGIEHARGNVIALMDGDLQNDPADIPPMLARLDDGYDLVHGWRHPRRDAWWSRQVPSRIANWLISRVTRFPIHDLGCTLKVMRRAVAVDLELYGQMHRFIPILAHMDGARCCEMVTRHRPRVSGRSHYGLGRTCQVLLDLITVTYLQRFRDNPMRLFGRMALASLAVAIAQFLFATIGGGRWSGGTPSGNLSPGTLMALMLAVQLFCVGIVAELATRVYFERRGRRPYKVRRLLASQSDAGDRTAHPAGSLGEPARRSVRSRAIRKALS